MSKKYLLRHAVRSAHLGRLTAKAIDLFIVMLLAFFLYPVGILLSISYLCICDALQGGQSVGKRLIGFAVVSIEDGAPCSIKQSTIRNLTIITPLLFAIIPLWGWLVAALLGLPLLALETYLIFSLDSGHRLGDVMADTTVTPLNPDAVSTGKERVGWFGRQSTSTNTFETIK